MIYKDLKFQIIVLLPVICLFAWLISCTKEESLERAEMRSSTQVALRWNKLLLELERNTPGYRPTVSSRMFAYVGMGAYESCLPAMPDYVSLETQVHGYKKPEMQGSNPGFYLPASLNASYARMLHYFFATAPNQLLEKIDRLESEQARLNEKAVDPQVLNRSAAFGRSAADAVWRWSTTDSMGHDGFLYNYDRAYVPPACPGCWQPTGNHPMPALTPHWGEVRPFVVKTGDLKEKRPLDFDESPGSAFYTEAMEVFTVSQPLSKENQWIAEFWSDDFPGLTMTPAGRWMSIATQAIEQAKPAFPQVMETYLKMGLALCDSGIKCWEVKYRYNLERPQEYITHTIKHDWSPLHDAPDFPSYPSGHSTFGAAAAEVLTNAFGESFEITDRTHEERQEFSGAPRTFPSFTEMARENALSRVVIGVHYRMDCEEGLRLGKIIGKKVADLQLRKVEAAR